MGKSEDNGLCYMPAWQLYHLLCKLEISPVELIELFLSRIDRLNPSLHALLTVCGDQAINQARIVERELVRGELGGPLQGLPIVIKDLAQTQGIRTTRGSLIFENYIPKSDEPVVERIKQSGAIILGKSNTPEFGHRGTTENRLVEPCCNPWDLSRTSGGSSGGSAVSIAAGLSPLAHGNDGGGSIRIPASFCGVYGFKPSAGVTPSVYRGIGGWNVFSQHGSLTSTVKDSALMLNVMSGSHPDDALSNTGDSVNFLDGLDDGIKGFHIAWSPSLGGIPVDPEVIEITESAVKSFIDSGAALDDPPFSVDSEWAKDTFKTIFLSDMDASYGKLLDRQSDLLTTSLKIWLEEARGWPASKLAMALRQLEWLRFQIYGLFQQYDLLITPTTAVPAFPIENRPDVIGGTPVDPWWGFNPFCYLFNMTGQPAASIPCGFTKGGLPVGLQIVGRRGEDAAVLRASKSFENAKPWKNRHPCLL